MNNEPVAWMYEKPNGASKLSFVKEKMLWEDMTETPLYTHPVKEDEGKVCARCGAIAYDPVILQTGKEQLTDEEIENIYKDFFGFKPTDKFAVDFARAILRKAQK